MTPTDQRRALIDALEAGPVVYACHVDGETDHTCVFDAGQNIHDCTLAYGLQERGLCKLDCPEWRPISFAKPTIEVKAEVIRQLLADLEAAEVDARRYRWLVECGSYSASPFRGSSTPWGLATGSSRGASKADLDAAIDALQIKAAGREG